MEETLDYQSSIIELPKPSVLIWVAVGLVIAGSLTALVWQIASLISLFRLSGFSGLFTLPALISVALVLASVGVIVLELYSVWFKSRRASEVLGTVFSAPAFIVLPPLLEAFARLVHIPGISAASADGKTVGIMLGVGAVCGFIGFAHFLWYSQLRRAPVVMKVESIPTPVEAVVLPPASPIS